MVILDWKDFIFTLLNIEILKLLDFSGISVTGWARNWHVGDILPMKLFSVDQKKSHTMWRCWVFLPEHNLWPHDRKLLTRVCRLLIIRYDFKDHQSTQTVEGSDSTAQHPVYSFIPLTLTSCLHPCHFLQEELKLIIYQQGERMAKTGTTMWRWLQIFTRNPTSSC